MKRFLILSISIILLTLSAGIQSITLAAPLAGSPSEKTANTVPNCPSAKNSSISPNCVPAYPPCTATNCYGLDPYTEGCGTATTYNHISIISDPIYEDYGGVEGGTNHLWGYVYNYYSFWCVANWNVVSLSVEKSVQLTISTTDSKGRFEGMCYPDGSCNTSKTYDGGVFPTWTNMIDGTNVTSACAWVPANGGGQECSNQ